MKNPTALAQVARAEVTDSNGLPQSTLDLGTLQPGESQYREFKVKHDHRVEVISRLPEQPNVFNSGPVTITSKPDPRPVNVDLAISSGRWLDDRTAQAVIKASFSDIGPATPGFKPLSVADALGSWYGALVVLPPKAADGSQPDNVLFQYKPGEFAPKIEKIEYPSGLSQETVTLSSTAAAHAAGTFAAFSLAVQGQSSEVLEVSWTFQNFGMIQRSDGGWNYIEGLNRLPPEVKQNLATTLAQNPGAKAYYIDTMYVFQNATYSVKKAKKIAADGSFNGMSVISASGGWTFEGSNGLANSRQNSVLNVAGIPLTIVAVESGGTKGVAPTATLIEKKIPASKDVVTKGMPASADWSRIMLTARADRHEFLAIPNAK